MMKNILAVAAGALVMTGSLSAQYAPSVSGSSIAAAEINSKPAAQTLAGVPTANCTVGKDLVLNTLTNVEYICTATPNVWSAIGGGGGGSVTNLATTSPITGGPITTTGTIACATCVTSGAALGANQLIVGGGGQASAVLGTLGTTTTVLHGNGVGNPTFSAVSLTADVTGALPAANGGTGQATYAVGDVLFASGVTALSRLADVATGNAIISGGVGVAPSWGKIGLTTHISGILPAGNGGTGQSTYTVGDLIYATGASAMAALNDIATGNALISGGVGVAPSWGKVALTTHVSGILPAANGGTGIANTATLTLGSSSHNYATLGTGLVKNTTTTGALSNGLSADVIALWSGTCNSSTFLRADGSCQASGGSGTVTVVGAGTLTSTALVTGGGTQTVQTAAATATMDSSGNISTPGTVASGVGGSAAGGVQMTQGTAPTAGTTAITLHAPTSVTSYRLVFPGAAGTGIVYRANVSNVVTETNVGPSTAGFVLTSNGASAPTFQAATGGGSPGGATGTFQSNGGSGTFAGQAFTFSGGSPSPTVGQNATESGHITLTQGTNITLTGTTDQSITLATNVPCNEVWGVLKISVTTAFINGTGGLFARWQHGSNDLTERFSVTATAGSVYTTNNPGVCARGTSADLKLTFNGDGTNSMAGYTVGAVSSEWGGFQIQ